MKTQGIQDKILFARLKNKDKQAFIKAYDLYLDQIYRFIFFKVSKKEEAEDLTSAVFLKTWNYIQDGNLTNYKTLKALIYKIARNSIIDYYRRVSHEETKAIDNPNIKIDLIDVKQDISRKIEIDFEYKSIENKLTELKDEYREVIVLRFINELSIPEIANILKKSKGNTRVLIFRALKALKDLTNLDK